MSNFHAAASVALSLVAFVISTASAQSVSERINEGRLQSCSTSGSATRTRENCEPEQVTIRTEHEIKLTIEPPELRSTQCEAVAAVNYHQRNTIARVNGTIEIADCTAASGTFTVVLRIRGESGEVESLELHETWQRSGAQDVEFTADYPIGENVELLGARVRSLRCTCADAPGDD